VFLRDRWQCVGKLDGYRIWVTGGNGLAVPPNFLDYVIVHVLHWPLRRVDQNVHGFMSSLMASVLGGLLRPGCVDSGLGDLDHHAKFALAAEALQGFRTAFQVLSHAQGHG
jgi:hypothetical protein